MAAALRARLVATVPHGHWSHGFLFAFLEMISFRLAFYLLKCFLSRSRKLVYCRSLLGYGCATEKYNPYRCSSAKQDYDRPVTRSAAITGRIWLSTWLLVTSAVVISTGFPDQVPLPWLSTSGRG